MPLSLPDQAERDAFNQGLDTNFSIIAPAGVGKTTAIVERIKRIAEAERAQLARLVVVTYTKKAAAELQERARDRIVGTGAAATEQLMAFNSATFGTLHSFCLDLLRRWGFHLGLPHELELVEDDTALWLAFLRNEVELLSQLDPAAQNSLRRLTELSQLTRLARRFPTQANLPPTLGPPPTVDLTAVLAYEPKIKRQDTLRNLAIEKEKLRKWVKAYTESEEWIGLPSIQKGGKPFIEATAAAFAPLRNWMAKAAAFVNSDLARRFRAYRIERAQVRYDDMVSLACELMQIPAARDAIRREQYAIILDEAQDTDAEQFEVLLSVAQDVGETRHWQAAFPAPARFSMVGDPQQSIYADRADIRSYLSVHQHLCNAGGQEAKFTVTMRCDHAIVDWVNETMPVALHGENEQVNYVELQARETAGPGRVQRLPLSIEGLPIKLNKEAQLRHEANALTNWMQSLEPWQLGADDWSEVALLCPRKTQLATLEKALEARELPVQNHSRKEVRSDEAAFAWPTALLTVLAEPTNAFELAGVLRNLFALSDDAIARYVQANLGDKHRHPLNLLSAASGQSAVTDALNALRALRLAIRDLPLRTAFQRILTETKLKERVESLPEGDRTGLDRLTAESIQAEESGQSLSDWAASLRDRLKSSGGEAHALPGHIQLLTCLKAKGLQWQVVILPYFFCPISHASASYPCAYRDASGAQHIALDKEHHVGGPKEDAAQRTQQAEERLLYVAMTRARHQLILVDDAALFNKQDGSFGHQLALTEGAAKAAAWAQVPTVQALGRPECPPAAEVPILQLEPARPLDDFNPEAIPFIRRILPSSLADHGKGHHHERLERDCLTEPEYPEISKSSGGGVAYGNWWHGMVENFNWSLPLSDWPEALRQSLVSCPLPERGSSEIERFLASPLAQTLSQACWIRTEVPLLWRADAQTAYDGSIDLIAELPSSQKLVLDWKTDRIEVDAQSELLAAYGAQLRAYCRALEAISGCAVTGQLYSTRAALSLLLPPG